MIAHTGPSPAACARSVALGSGGARGMRMIVTQHLRTAAARRAVRVDQRPRIDLETARGIRVNIGAGAQRNDPFALPEQQPARLKRIRGGGLV